MAKDDDVKDEKAKGETCDEDHGQQPAGGSRTAAIVKAAVNATREAQEEKDEIYKDMLKRDEKRDELDRKQQKERDERERAERDKRSQTLYRIAEARAASQDRTIKWLWIALVLSMLGNIALAGINITGHIPFIGDISMGGDAEALEVTSEGPKATPTNE